MSLLRWADGLFARVLLVQTLAVLAIVGVLSVMALEYQSRAIAVARASRRRPSSTWPRRATGSQL